MGEQLGLSCTAHGTWINTMLGKHLAVFTKIKEMLTCATAKRIECMRAPKDLYMSDPSSFGHDYQKTETT